MLVHPDTKSPHIVQGKEGKRPVFSTQIFSKRPFCIFVRQIHVHKYFLTFGHIATKVGNTEIVDEQWRWVVFIISFVSPWCTHTSKVISSLACLFDISISNNSNTAASVSGANYCNFIVKINFWHLTTKIEHTYVDVLWFFYQFLYDQQICRVGNTDSMEIFFPLFSMTRKYLENFLFYFIFAKEPPILKISARTRSRL